MKLHNLKFIIPVIVILFIATIWSFKNVNLNLNHKIGDRIDSLNNVIVYYNGAVGNITERNLAPDGYNLGLKYQCVEFVKRYYYEHLDHKMPNSYGDAKDFFDNNLKDGQVNRDRALVQYTNPSKTKPKIDDLLVFGGDMLNKFGHVAIVSELSENEIEIIQQNAGQYGKSRGSYKLEYSNGKWTIDSEQILGWLRKE